MKFCTRCGNQIEEGQICSCSEISSVRTSQSTSQVAIFNAVKVRDFIETMKNHMGIGEPARNATDCYERGQHIVPDSIKTNESEIPVKQYNIAVLRTLWKFERAEGRLQVTNKRVLFRACGRSIGGRTTLQHEFAVDEIAGIEARRDYKFSIVHLLIGCLVIALFFSIGYSLITPIVETMVETEVETMFGMQRRVQSGISAGGAFLGIVLWLGSLIPFFAVRKKFLLKLLPLGFGLGSIWAVFIAARITAANIPIFILCNIATLIIIFGLCLFIFRPNLVISIKNKGAAPAVDISRTKSTGIFNKVMGKSEGSGFAEVMPTDETEIAIREIGAMIDDIQKLGDFGIQKWIAQ